MESTLMEPMAMSAVFKQQAHQLIDELPDDAGWNELIYRLQVRKDIEAGLVDSQANRVTEVDELIRELEL